MASGSEGPATTYQRLEFLGDRVLGLGAGEMLFRAFPDAGEGDLSRRLSELVRKETCAAVARDWDVGPHLRLGPGAKAAGRRNPSILGDVCEALIGAVFLDGGYEAALAVVERAFGGRMQAQAAFARVLCELFDARDDDARFAVRRAEIDQQKAAQLLDRLTRRAR